MFNKYNVALAALASKEESRYMLHAIQVTPKETVATDGNVLGRVTTPNFEADSFPMTDSFVAKKEFDPFLLPVETAKQIAKALPLPDKPSIPILGNAAINSKTENGKVQVGVTDLEHWQTFDVPPMSGTFPDYRKVEQKKDKAKFEVILDAQKVKQMIDFLAKFAKEGRGQSPVKFRFYDGKEAIRLDARADTGQEFMGLIMPMRDGNDPL